MYFSKIILAISLSFISTFHISWAQAQIFINTNNTFNLGKVGIGAQNFKFYVYNIGNKPLIIESVSASCGCTNLHMDNKTLNPGDSSIVFITLNTSAIGSKTSNLTFRSNSSKDSVLNLMLEAFVINNISISPSSILIDSSQANNREYISEFKITNNSESILKLYSPCFNEKFKLVETNIGAEMQISSKETKTIKIKYISNDKFNKQKVISDELLIPCSDTFNPLIKIRVNKF